MNDGVEFDHGHHDDVMRMTMTGDDNAVVEDADYDEEEAYTWSGIVTTLSYDNDGNDDDADDDGDHVDEGANGGGDHEAYDGGIGNNIDNSIYNDNARWNAHGHNPDHCMAIPDSSNIDYHDFGYERYYPHPTNTHRIRIASPVNIMIGLILVAAAMLCLSCGYGHAHRLRG